MFCFVSRLRCVQGEQRKLQPVERGGGGAAEEAGEDGENQRRARQYGTGKGGESVYYSSVLIFA